MNSVLEERIHKISLNYKLNPSIFIDLSYMQAGTMNSIWYSNELVKLMFYTLEKSMKLVGSSLFLRVGSELR